MQQLYNNAALCCDELNQHLSGQIMLDALEISSRRQIIKIASTKSLYFFSKVVLGFDLLTPETHKRWADDLQEKFLAHNRMLRVKPRGTFKTTLFGEAFILWVWGCISAKIKIGYLSANQALLDEVSNHMDFFIGFKTDSLYNLVFGIKRDINARKNTNDVINILGRDASKKGTSLMFRTLGGATNGLHPNLIILDDPMDKKDRASEAVRLQKRRAYDALFPLLVPFEGFYDGVPFKLRHLIMITTRWHLDDLVTYIKKKSARFDIIEEGIYHPTDTDEQGRRALNYPELHTHEWVQETIEDLSEVFFACQYLNDPLPDGLRLFKIENMKLIDVNSEATFDYNQGSNYVFLDPAKGTEKGAFPAVVFANRLNGKTVFFDAIDTKLPLDETIALACRKSEIYKTKLFVFETNGTTLLKSAIKRSMLSAGYTCRIVEIHETRNKAERIASMQPDLLYGENYFREDYALAYPEMMKQLTLYPAYGPVDFPDVIEKAISYISKNSPGKFSDGGRGGTGSGASTGSLTGSVGSKTSW